MATGFNAVSMGNGTLSFNGREVGYLKGDVKYAYEYDIEDFYTGVPAKLRGRITKKVSAKLTAPIAEFNMDNVAMALGGLTIVSNDGSPVTYTNEVVKVKSRGSASVRSAILAHSNISAVTVHESDGTTVVAATEYILDANLGIIYAAPGGDIDSADHSLKVTYTATEPVSKQVNLGTTFALAQQELLFEHTSPVNGKRKRVYMPLASSDGKVNLNFSEGNFIVNEVSFEAIADDDHPMYPLGYVWEEQ